MVQFDSYKVVTHFKLHSQLLFFPQSCGQTWHFHGLDMDTKIFPYPKGSCFSWVEVYMFQPIVNSFRSSHLFTRLPPVSHCSGRFLTSFCVHYSVGKMESRENPVCAVWEFAGIVTWGMWFRIWAVFNTLCPDSISSFQCHLPLVTSHHLIHPHYHYTMDFLNLYQTWSPFHKS